MLQDIAVYLDTLITQHFEASDRYKIVADMIWDGHEASMNPQTVEVRFYGRVTGTGEPEVDVKISATCALIVSESGTSFTAMQAIGAEITALLAEIEPLI